jgi:lipoprotein-releasing system permease protein
MNVPFFIARKYFFSKKKRSFINFISIISMVGVCLGTMTLVIVLSVFNGLEDLNRQIFKAFDPDLKITANNSKSFINNLDLIAKINKVNDVAYVTQVYQDKALAKSEDAQMIVVIKGVDSTFEKNTELKSAIVEGKMKIFNNRSNAFVGGGVFNILDLNIDDYLRPLVIIYPKNQKINTLNPLDNVNQIAVDIAGVFVLEQQYDNYIYLPLTYVEELTGKTNKRTSYEITLKKGADLEKIRKQILSFLPNKLNIKNRDEQNAPLLKAIKIEKFFIFIALFFIIGIASFNIFYSLSMLVIDKKDDIETMSSFGATKTSIRNLFMMEGIIIAIIGMILGLVIGLVLCFIQIKYGVVKLGMQYALVDSYPIKILVSDVLFSVFGILLITILAAILPAKKAVNYMLNQH